MKELEKICKIRNYENSDESFIVSTFLTGLYHGNEFFNIMDKKIFLRNYRPIIKTILRRREVKMACLREDPDVILGYSILSKDFLVIDWVYVKAKWRKFGIAKLLLPKYPKQYTHFTTLGLILSKKFGNLKFNPFNLGD